MTTYLALYRGTTVADSELIAASADPDLVADFAARLLKEERQASLDDPVLLAKHNGERRVLRIVRAEARARGEGEGVPG